MSKGTPFFLLEQVAVDAGAVLAGAKLYFYQTGTTTDQNVYQESTLDTAHAQPVVADSGGTFAAIWLDPNATTDYRVKLTDSSDNTIFQVDGVPRYRENFESGSFTVTWVGFSADPSATTCNWYRIGRVVILEMPLGTGTSNSTSFAFTGLPDALTPDTTQYYHLPYAVDNNAHLAGGAVAQVGSTGTISLAPADAAFDTAGWTASSTKGINTAGTIIYRLTDT